MDEIDVGEPIQATSECLRRLRELVHLPGELQRAGYVLDAITGSDLERKRRCEKCCKVMKKERQRKRPADSKVPLTSTTDGAETPPKLEATSDDEDTTVQDSPKQSTGENTSKITDVLAKTVGDRVEKPVMICKFHPGKVAYRKWTCCGNPVFSKPCTGKESHAARQYKNGELEKSWQFYETTHEPLPTHKAAIVIDCEMGTAASGESELIRLSVVDFFTRAVLLDCLVYPDMKMAHYNTKYSGVTRQSMEDARRRRSCIFGRSNARRAVCKFIGLETVVIGHAGHQDLTSLRWIHRQIIDTLIIETKKRQAEIDARVATADDLADVAECKQDSEKEMEERKEPQKQQEGGLSLKYLSLKRLNRVIQIKGRGHDSLEDALATRDLLHWHLHDLQAQKQTQEH